LDARGDIRNNLLSFLIGAKKRLGYQGTGGGYFLTHNLGNAHQNMHRVDAWLNLLESLGIGVYKCAPYLTLKENEEAFAENFLKASGISKGDLLVGIHPGARIKTRCWPLERFAKVAEYARDTCKAKIIVFLEPDGYGEDIPIRGENFKARLTLRELVALIKRLDLLVCNDGGAMHIATAVSTPVVAIFGPTDSLRFGPYGGSNTVIIEENISCRPCFDYCKFNKALCLERIGLNSVESAVYKAVEALKREPLVNAGLRRG